MKRPLFAPTRRHFLAASSALAALAALPASLRAQLAAPPVPESTLANDPERPQFHLLPARNWMNDPNGPIFFDGNYHMFFQYNPLAATWGDMSWNHAISPDMVHWTHAPVALTPTPGSPDSFGVFSGSAIAITHDGSRRVYAVYTGTRQSDDAHATIRDGANNIQESQCLAWSDDPRLIHWTKDPEPIVPVPPRSLKYTGFRDPSVFRLGDYYYMTVGSGESKVGGCVLLYRSPVADSAPANALRHWEYLHKLTAGQWDGTPTSNPCDDGEMWECPEFFPLGDAHVLIYSTLGKVFWQSGQLDTATMKFNPHKTGLLDLDAFYAPKTQLDAQGRRILWGWIPERRPEAAMRRAGWSGMMSLPRLLTLDPDGTLRISTPQQVDILRAATLAREPSPTGVLKTLHHASGELLAGGTAGFPFELTLSMGNTPLVKITYDPATNSFLTDGHTIALQPGDLPQVHAYVDGSVIEMILSERIGYTKRFYYDTPTAPDITAFATGGRHTTMHAWKIRPISPNRLTTPAA